MQRIVTSEAIGGGGGYSTTSIARHTANCQGLVAERLRRASEKNSQDAQRRRWGISLPQRAAISACGICLQQGCDKLEPQ
jgi:hypothetical protein